MVLLEGLLHRQEAADPAEGQCCPAALAMGNYCVPQAVLQLPLPVPLEVGKCLGHGLVISPCCHAQYNIL